MTNLPLLDHLVGKGKPLIISTGMSRMEEGRGHRRFPEAARGRVCAAALQQHVPHRLRRHQPALHGPVARCFGVPVGYSGTRARDCGIHRRLGDGRQHHRAPHHAGSHDGGPRPRRQPGSRRASRRWCAIFARWLWRWVPGRKNSSRAAKSSTARCWARAWSPPAASNPVRSSAPA